MITRISSAWVRLFVASVLLGAIIAIPGFAAAPDASFTVQLIWGTDGDRPKDKPLKDVDPKLQEKLKGVFKWRNYFEVDRKPLTIAKDNQKLKLSDKCEIQVQDLGGSRIEIRLFGEGKFVVKHAQNVVPGEVIVLAGDDKDKTAWFVVLTPK